MKDAEQNLYVEKILKCQPILKIFQYTKFQEAKTPKLILLQN